MEKSSGSKGEGWFHMSRKAERSWGLRGHGWYSMGKRRGWIMEEEKEKVGSNHNTILTNVGTVVAGVRINV